MAYRSSDLRCCPACGDISSRSSSVCRSCSERERDEERLQQELAPQFEEVQRLDPVDGSGQLQQIALSVRSIAVRLAAVARLQHAEGLAAVARGIASLDPKNSATVAPLWDNASEDPPVTYLRQIHSLPSVAPKSKTERRFDDEMLSKVRTAAIQKVTDQAVLAQIARVDPDVTICLAAVERLRDPVLLAGLAKSEGWPPLGDGTGD